MGGRFADKVVLVVGGNSGIGLASAKAFSHEGARVAVTGRDADTLASAATEIGSDVLALRLDVSKLESHHAVFEQISARYGRVDVLFANAGTGQKAAFGAALEAHWQRLIDVNLKGIYFMTQTMLPLMRAGSNIVFTSSVAAAKPRRGYSVYAASKAGIASVARSLGAELVERGIRVNVVSPGPIDTPMFSRVPMSAEARARFRENVAAENPMRRWGTPTEVANAVLFLASDEASFITGADLPVDGGAANF